MQPFVALLGQELDLTSQEIADIIWIANQMQAGDGGAMGIDRTQPASSTAQQTSASSTSERISPPITDKQTDTDSGTKAAEVHPPNPDRSNFSSQLAFQMPDARSLRSPLSLARSLKPLLQRVATGWSNVLDEEATVQRIADEQIWMPVVKPTLEPWLDLALVVDESVSMQIWQRTIGELQRLLAHYGVFRDVRVWGLVINSSTSLIASDEGVWVRPGLGASARKQSLRHPKELLDPSGRRLILVATDCVSSFWRSGEMLPALKLWAKSGQLAIVQMLPEWLWARTGLGLAAGVRFSSLAAGATNQQLLTRDLSPWDEIDLETGIKVPVVTLESDRFGTWAQMVAARGGVWSPGVVFEPEPLSSVLNEQQGQVMEIGAVQRVQRFRSTASPMARRLAGFLASAPAINLPVVRIVQDRLLPDSQQVHVAEVFLGGLLKPLVELQGSLIGVETMNPDTVPYDFMDGVREVLLESVPTSDVVNVLGEVSAFVAERLGLTVDAFMGVLRNPTVADGDVVSQSRPFAMVTAEILKKLGGEYAVFAQELESVNQQDWERFARAAEEARQDPDRLDESEKIRQDFYRQIIELHFKKIEETIAHDFADGSYEFQTYSRDREDSDIDEIHVNGVETVNVIEVIGTIDTDDFSGVFEVSAKIIFSVEFTQLNHEGFIPKIHDDTNYRTISGLISNQSVNASVRVYVEFLHDPDASLEIDHIDLIIQEPISLDYQDAILTESEASLSSIDLGSRKIYSNLPLANYPRFIGREREIAMLLEQLSPNVREYIIAITGVGGIGKTTLAIEVAYLCLQSRINDILNKRIPTFDAFIFISSKNKFPFEGSLLEHPPRDKTFLDLFEVILQTLEEPIVFQVRHDLEYLVYAALSKQATLLIVDNLETLDSNEREKTLSFLNGVPHPTKVIVTTREHLGLHQIHLHNLTPIDSTQLINILAKDIVLTQSQINQIYEKSCGVPLVIQYLLSQIAAGYDIEDILVSDLMIMRDSTQNSSTSRKNNSTKSVLDVKRLQEIQKLRMTIRTSRNDAEIIKALKRLGVIAKGDKQSISDVLSVLSRVNQNHEVTIEVIKTIGKIGKGNSSAIQALVRLLTNNHNILATVEILKSLAKISNGEANTIRSICNLLTFNKNNLIIIEAINTLSVIAKCNQSAVQKVLSLWTHTSDKNIKKSIIKGLGEIGNGDRSVINKLISILRIERDSVLTQLTADSLAKIAVGDQDAIQEMVIKLQRSPIKPKTLRENLRRNLNKLDPGNAIASEYAKKL